MEQPNFVVRLWLACILPWKLLFDGGFAARVGQLTASGALPGPAAKPELTAAEPEPVGAESVEPEPDLTAALQLLAILQREGRFIDFLQEDVSGASDAEIGAVARVVWEGCKRGLSEHVQVLPIRAEAEGAAVTLEPGYDAKQTRITGNLVGEPPFNGTLAHHGWRATSVSLPKLSNEHDPQVLAPAEVEL